METLHAAWRPRRCALVEANLLAPTLESGLDPMEQTTSGTQAAVPQATVSRPRSRPQQPPSRQPGSIPVRQITFADTLKL